MIYELKTKDFWLDEAVDSLLKYVEEHGKSDEMITCAAGMTPSCPIHFGILREIAISSFVAEELKSRGIKAHLVYYWDDFDHFCKIPYYTTKADVEKYIGMPLGDVPDFDGSYNSYSEHYMYSFEMCLHKLGFTPDYNYQSVSYNNGLYAKYLRRALEKRYEIFDIINANKKPYSAEVEKQKEAYYPLEIYCASCNRDSAKAYDYDSKSYVVKYKCKDCGFEGQYTIGDNFKGKLVWKANWAARWTDDNVMFESSGENQLTDTGSYAVSSRISKEVFNGGVPFSLLYRFIGVPGVAKVSRALGEKALATRFSSVLEPAVARWLLVKNSPAKPFSVDIEQGIFRIYHEWDMLCTRIEDGSASKIDKRLFAIATRNVPLCKIRVPFKTITMALTIANGDKKLALKLLKKILNLDISEEKLLVQIKVRFEAAYNWLYVFGNISEETQLLTSFNSKAWKTFSDDCKKCVSLVYSKLEKCSTEKEMEAVLYSAPKELLAQKVNMPCEQFITEVLPSQKEECASLQKELFKALYLLLLGIERGPKLATLMSLLDISVFKNLLRGVRYDS